MPPDRPPTEGREWREVLVTYGPALLVAFFLNWALATHFGFTPRRALMTSIGVGIILALVLQHVVQSRGDRR